MNGGSFRPSPTGATLHEVQQFEREWALRLPDDYRSFLLESNGGEFSRALCKIELIQREVYVEVLLGLNNSCAGRRDLSYWLLEYRAEMPAGFVVIGMGSTGLFTLGTKAPFTGVFFWDDALAFPESSIEEDNTFQVATSFGAFMANLGIDSR